MSEELKACPFCEGELFVRIMGSRTFGLCNNCSNVSAEACTRDDAVFALNQRPIEDALHQRIAELEADLQVSLFNSTIHEDWHNKFIELEAQLEARDTATTSIDSPELGRY